MTKTEQSGTPRTDLVWREVKTPKVTDHCYIESCKLERDLTAAKQRIAELEGENDGFKRECALNLHRVIACGVAATHPDANLVNTGAYAKKWGSAQLDSVKELRQRADSLAAENEAMRRALTWRKVEDELPINNYWVIVRFEPFDEDGIELAADSPDADDGIETGNTAIGCYMPDKKKWHILGGHTYRVTYWMPEPTPPKLALSTPAADHLKAHDAQAARDGRHLKAAAIRARKP